MRNVVCLFAVAFLSGGLLLRADNEVPNFSGTWKLDPARSEVTRADKDLVVVINQNGDKITVTETRGNNTREDVSSFTCGTLGKECPMEDGGAKAQISVYYNGPMLILLKTHGRKGSEVEKQRLSLSHAGDSMTADIMHIDPQDKAEKLVFSKAQ